MTQYPSSKSSALEFTNSSDYVQSTLLFHYRNRIFSTPTSGHTNPWVKTDVAVELKGLRFSRSLILFLCSFTDTFTVRFLIPYCFFYCRSHTNFKKSFFRGRMKSFLHIAKNEKLGITLELFIYDEF